MFVHKLTHGHLPLDFNFMSTEIQKIVQVDPSVPMALIEETIK